MIAIRWVLTLALAATSVVAHAVTEWGTVECLPSHVTTHNPGLVRVPDRLICFEAYLSNFGTAENRDEDGGPLGIPHWVAHRIKKAKSSPESRSRPRSWFTVPDLQKNGFAPTDASYQFSQR